MPEIYLASSALAHEGFEGRRTIEEALTTGFDGVQLFLDPRYRDSRYLQGIINELKSRDLGVLIHLPDLPQQTDLVSAGRLVREIHGSRALIHYGPTMFLPKITGSKVGWENSPVRPLDTEHTAYLRQVTDRVRWDRTFFVFDMGRLLYASGHEEEERTIRFIREQIRALNPRKDVIHLADKTSWVLKFRNCMCVLGEGVMREFLPDIRSFRGVVVFEHEDLNMAKESLPVLRSRN